MGTKRSADSAEPTTTRTYTQPQKKARLSPTADERVDSSEPSSRSVSEDSALHSSPAISKHNRTSSISSIETLHDSGDESDSSSASSSSSESEDDSSADEDENEIKDNEHEQNDEIITIGGPAKPSMQIKGAQKSKMRDLHGRLQNMLLQLAQANQELEREDVEVYNMENVEDGDAHIEMNLGLGVLEEKTADGSSSESESSSDEDDEGLDDDGEGVARETLSRKHAKSDAMSKLLGGDRDQQKANIEVLT